jgi:polysaccharide biosynthesis protein PslG
MDLALRTSLVLALALAALLGWLAPAQARDVPRDFYGTVLDGGVLGAPAGVLAQQWPRMAASGVESARVVFSWADAQPLPGGPFDFSRTDQLVAGASAHQIDLLPVVIYAPPWARADLSQPSSPPAHEADYAAYLQALVGRYGPGGSFWSEHPELPPRPVRAWQIWNEPQLRYQWSTPGFAQGYGALLRASYQALKAADPGCTVVLAGATNFSWRAIATLYARGGIHGFFDVAAVHPYTSNPKNVVRVVRLVRKVLRRHGDGRLPIWVTELGFPASKGRVRSRNSLQTTPRAAARRLTRAYSLLIARRSNPRLLVGRAYWYTWASSYGGTDIFSFSGLWRFDGLSGFRPQRQLAAYVHSARLHEGCRKLPSGRCA